MKIVLSVLALPAILIGFVLLATVAIAFEDFMRANFGRPWWLPWASFTVWWANISVMAYQWLQR